MAIIACDEGVYPGCAFPGRVLRLPSYPIASCLMCYAPLLQPL